MEPFAVPGTGIILPDGLAAVAEFEPENGALTDAERAEARQVLIDAGIIPPQRVARQVPPRQLLSAHPLACADLSSSLTEQPGALRMSRLSSIAARSSIDKITASGAHHGSLRSARAFGRPHHGRQPRLDLPQRQRAHDRILLSWRVSVEERLGRPRSTRATPATPLMTDQMILPSPHPERAR